MTNNTLTHYQTSFCAYIKNREYKPLSKIQNIIYGWLLRREKDRICRNAKKDFFHKCDWNKLYQTDSSVATNTVDTGEFKAWAFSYTHTDSKLRRGHYWYVDIGIKEQDSIATFYCRVSFSQNRYDLTSKDIAPPINTPRFIRDIISKKSGLKIFSGHSPRKIFPLLDSRDLMFHLFDNDSEIFHLLDHAYCIEVKDGRKLEDLIKSSERRYAIIVFNVDSDELREEAADMARELVGKSQVFMFNDDPQLAKALRHYLDDNDFWIPRGRLRIFYPLNPEYPRLKRHRWFNPSAPDYPDTRKRLISGLLRVYHMEEPGSITNISEIGHLISMRNLRKRLSESSACNKDMQEFEVMWDSREQEFGMQESSLKQEIGHWMSEVEEKEDELQKAQAKTEAFEFGSRKKQSIDIDWSSELKRYVCDLSVIVKIFSRIYSKRLLFADEAYKSANNYQNYQVSDRTWSMFIHIATTLYDLKFGEEQVGDLATRFRALSKFEYAKTEGKQSKSNRSIRASRRIKVDGKEYEIWAHIKYGTKPPKMLRIHFAFDEEKKKIVIGHVGDHMKNASTQSIK